MLFFLFSGFYLNQDQTVTVSEPQFKVIPITYVSNELEPNHIHQRHNHKDHKEHERHSGIHRGSYWQILDRRSKLHVQFLFVIPPQN